MLPTTSQSQHSTYTQWIDHHSTKLKWAGRLLIALSTIALLGALLLYASDKVSFLQGINPITNIIGFNITKAIIAGSLSFLFLSVIFLKSNCRRRELQSEPTDAETQFNRGNSYYHGRVVEQNYQEAVRWNTHAAEQEDAGAQLNLALCYENGREVEQNNQEAIRLYTLAVEQGHARAL